MSREPSYLQVSSETPCLLPPCESCASPGRSRSNASQVMNPTNETLCHRAVPHPQYDLLGLPSIPIWSFSSHSAFSSAREAGCWGEWECAGAWRRVRAEPEQGVSRLVYLEIIEDYSRVS